MSDTYAIPWKQIAENWSQFGDGNHPSLFDISAYERFLLSQTKGLPAHVLLLGATPRLRDMFAKHANIRVTVFDINREMIQATTSLMEEKTDREEWVEGDWLAPPFALARFDALLRK